MKTFLMLVALLAVSGLFAQEKSESTLVTLKGYIVDAMCGAAMAKGPNMEQRAAKHSRSCALDEQCAAAGYGIITGTKWYPFDAAGNAKAKSGIQKSKRAKGHYFQVTGILEGGRLKVRSLKEVPVP
jgi:hypothetical protein